MSVMAKRFDELSIESQAEFQRRAESGASSMALALDFDVSYEVARRRRKEFRDAAREALAKAKEERIE